MRVGPVRAALYARVSSEQQAEAGTIDSQVEALRARIVADGLPVEKELEFIDEGYSGATLVRPALERLRDVAAAGPGYAYYRCVGTDSYRFGGQRVCSNRQVRTDRLEEAVWGDVCSLLSDPRRIEEEWERRLAEKREEPWDGAEQLRSSIHKLKRGIGRLIDSYQEGLLEKPDFEPRIRRAKDRLKSLEGELQQCLGEVEQREALRSVIGRLRDFADKVADGLEQADWATRRAIIRALVKSVEIDEEQVRIIYKISPEPVCEDRKSRSSQHCWRRDGSVSILGWASRGDRGHGPVGHQHGDSGVDHAARGG